MTLLTPEASVTLRQKQSTSKAKVRSTRLGELDRVPQSTQAIYADEIQIGNLTLYDVPGRPFCYLKQIDVDHQYLHMGFRRRALQKLVDSLKNSSRIKELVVTISPQCADMIGFFKGMGFYNSGELVDGEYVFKMAL